MWWFPGMESWSAEDYAEWQAQQAKDKKSNIKSNPEVKVEKVFTLSRYEYGKHFTRGAIEDTDIEFGRLTFAESLVPFYEMMKAFKECRLGSQIRLTLEVVKDD
jgi:hypothetical protein